MSKRTTLIFSILVGYIVLQFLWWEVLLVKQSDSIISLKQNIAALASSDEKIILNDIAILQQKKNHTGLYDCGRRHRFFTYAFVWYL